MIRSYEVVAGGETYTNPFVSFFVRQTYGGGTAPNVDTFVTLPGGVAELSDGDSTSLDLYWLTLPHNAQDYYGPNEALRTHLEEKPDSWETVLREARGNKLEVEATGGEVKNAYPLIVASSGDPEIHVDVTGGVGAVPMRFEGLDSSSYRLYRSVSEEEGDDACVLSPADDSWQVDYDPDTFTYAITYNPVLDDAENSSWVLKK